MRLLNSHSLLTLTGSRDLLNDAPLISGSKQLRGNNLNHLLSFQSYETQVCYLKIIELFPDKKKEKILLNFFSLIPIIEVLDIQKIVENELFEARKSFYSPLLSF